MKATTYQGLGVAAIVTTVLVMLLVPLLSSLEDMTGKLVAYSDCANQMMDYAFLGKVYNFTDCYLSRIHSENLKKPICRYVDGFVVCDYENKTFIFNVNTSSNEVR